MRIAVLGERDTCCLLLNHHGFNILLDCSASPVLALATPQNAAEQHTAGAQQQPPHRQAAKRLDIQLKVPQLQDVVRTQELHAILATSPYALLGLPHLRQLLQHEGKQLPLHVYCTEPVYHALQHVATELLETQQLLRQQPAVQQSQQQHVSPNHLQLYQFQMQQHVQQLAAQQQQQTWQHHVSSQAPAYDFTAAAAAGIAAVGPPIPPPQPPPLAPAAAAAGTQAGAGMPVTSQAAPAPPPAHLTRLIPGPRPPPRPPATSYPSLLQCSATGAATISTAAAIPSPRPPPMPPPQAAAAAADVPQMVKWGAGGIFTPAGAAAEGHATSAVPPCRPTSVLPPPAAAAAAAAVAAVAVPPRPPAAPPPGSLPPASPAAAAAVTPAAHVATVPLPVAHLVPSAPIGAAAAAPPAAAAVEGTFFRPPIPPPAPPPGSPSAAAADTCDLRSGPAAAKTLDAADRSHLVPVFTAEDLQSVLDQLQIVRFGERVVLPGCWGMAAEARPSGSSCVGAAMWIISTGSQRIAYLSPASVYLNHSAQLHQPSLQGLDALVLGPGSLCPDVGISLNPRLGISGSGLGPFQDSGFGAAMLQVAAAAAAHAVRAGGRVLVPVLPSGSVFQLLEHIPAALPELVPNGSQIPIYYLSPVAQDTLATVNSCCEYLESDRRDLVLSTGTAPFKCGGYVTSGRITLLTGTGSSGESRQQQQWAADVAKVADAGPCVAFVSLWSMAAGPGAMLSDLWSSNPNNLLLLTEQGPLTGDWLQGCSLLWRQQQHRWQIQYCPVSSTAGLIPTAVAPSAAAAAARGQVPANNPAAAAGLTGQESCKSAAACRTAAEGCLTARQLVRLLQPDASAAGSNSRSGCSCTVQQLILSLQDQALLLQALRDLRQSLDDCQATTLSSTVRPPAQPQPHPTTIASSSKSLNFQVIDLPEALLHVTLTKQLAESLLLTPIAQQISSSQDADAQGATFESLQHGVMDVDGTRRLAVNKESAVQTSIARLRGVLRYQSGVWRLEALPIEDAVRTEDDGVPTAAAVDDQQQTESLMWGSVDVGTLLGDLQAAGFASLYLSKDAVTLDDGREAATTVITLPEVDAEIRLTEYDSEVICDDCGVRKQLTDALMKQLQVL